MLRWLGRTPGVPSRTELLIGSRGVVTQAIDTTLGTGRVTVKGEDWAARSPGVVPAGVEVRVIAADGIVLEVLPL
jgi:membrane protein implicated in regulation of membrane protease activity